VLIFPDDESYKYVNDCAVPPSQPESKLLIGMQVPTAYCVNFVIVVPLQDRTATQPTRDSLRLGGRNTDGKGVGKRVGVGVGILEGLKEGFGVGAGDGAGVETTTETFWPLAAQVAA